MSEPDFNWRRRGILVEHKQQDKTWHVAQFTDNEVVLYDGSLDSEEWRLPRYKYESMVLSGQMEPQDPSPYDGVDDFIDMPDISEPSSFFLHSCWPFGDGSDSYSGITGTLDGEIFDMRVYDRALDKEEIQQWHSTMTTELDIEEYYVHTEDSRISCHVCGTTMPDEDTGWWGYSYSTVEGKERWFCPEHNERDGV